MSILETKALKKYYGKGESLVRAVDSIDLKVEEGEFAAIVGTSGSGKSTLLHLLGGLDRPTEGTVLVDGRELYSMKEDVLAIFRRRKIGFVFQAFNLIPVLNVWENIVLPAGLDGKPVDQAFIDELMDTLGIKAKKDCLPNTLSGGQQQRVAIARALSTKPSIILADEPTGNLDSRTGEEMMALLKKSVAKYHQTLVLITHDEKIAQVADRVIRIEDGRIVGLGGRSASGLENSRVSGIQDGRSVKPENSRAVRQFNAQIPDGHEDGQATAGQTKAGQKENGSDSGMKHVAAGGGGHLE